MTEAGTTDALPLTSYKIRFHDAQVRAVPASDASGAPFVGPGVDLRGADAIAAVEAARPVIAWLDAREPGVVVRSLSVKTAGHGSSSRSRRSGPTRARGRCASIRRTRTSSETRREKPSV